MMWEKTGEDDRNQEKLPTLDINQLKFICPLGRGAKGVVFHVQIQDTSEDLALKVVLKSSIKSRGEKQSNGIKHSRVSFEQQVLRDLDHPLLPRLRGVIETEEIIGYAIDYCPGGDLNSLRKQQVEKMFSDVIIRFYGAEMVLALEYLHKNGIVYRDLKPENMLIQENGHLMLVDFDLSTKLAPRSPLARPGSHEPERRTPAREKTKRAPKPKFYAFCKSGIAPEDEGKTVKSHDGSGGSDSVGKSNSFVGTEEYVAPEIIQGNGHDFAVDWWCYGVVLHEMLYGTTPFKGANRKETFYRVLSKEAELVGETTPLRDLIRRLLEKDPKRRISLEGIKGHDFFKGVDWEMIVRLPRPPFIPVRPDVVGGLGGVKDVEAMVHGIFHKDKNNNIEYDHNNNKKKNSNNSNNDDNNKDDQNRGCEENKRSCRNENNDGESMNRCAWVEGLNQPSVSSNFLVF